MSPAAQALDEAFRRDPEAIHAMISNRVPCNTALANDPFVVVEENQVLRSSAVPHYTVGALGLINGVLAAAGLPLVASNWSDPNEHGVCKLIGFCDYTPPATEGTPCASAATSTEPT